MVCLLTLSILALSTVVHDPCASGKASDVRQGGRIPCYVVISNEVRDGDEQKIRILIDKDDVTEAKLVRLHQHFSAMYSDVERLYVYVSTSLDFRLGNYTTVEDIERRQAGLPPKPKIWEKDAQGILMRTGGIEKFGYKAAGGDMSDMRYILVRGEDPDCNNCGRLEGNILDNVETAISTPGKTQNDVPCYFVMGNFEMDNRLCIGVFINAEDASELNLLSLLRHFSLRYPDSQPFVIKVYTDSEQRNDFILQAMGEREYFVPAMSSHFAAAIFRAAGNQVIRYRRPHETIATIVVQGVDIFPGIDLK